MVELCLILSFFDVTLSSAQPPTNVCNYKFYLFRIQQGRYLKTLYLEVGRDLGTSEADKEAGVL